MSLDHPSTAHEALRLVSAQRWASLTRVAGVQYADAARRPEGECVAVLAHISDTHICDVESPARLEYLDGYGHPGATYRSVLGDIGTYRPQEILTVPVAIATLTALYRLGSGPVSRRPIDVVVFTGDLVDNAQSNELDWFAALLSGHIVRPTSGNSDASWWVGAPHVQWSPWYWHPSGHRSGRRDVWVERYGFPFIDDLIESAHGRFASDGLAMPRVIVHGNHDLLLQGTVTADAQAERLATGSHRVVDLAPTSTPLSVLEATPRTGPARYPHTNASPVEWVPSDHARRLVVRGAFGHQLSSKVFGREVTRHDRTEAHDVAVTADVRVIALDTVNPYGGWEGSLDRSQLIWLRERLGAGHEAYLIVASHHPSWCLVNPYQPQQGEPRVLADELLGTLLDEPRVICWMSGHVHRHSVTLHRCGERVLPEITSASLIDWPQQWRTLEIIREPGGTVALASTAFDHAGLVDPELSGSDDPLHLAGLSRLIAHHIPDVHHHLERRRVRHDPPHEHNVIVRVPDPSVRLGAGD